MPAPANDPTAQRARSLLGPGIATLVALAILLALGAWQMQRRSEKREILAALERSVAAPARPLDAAAIRALRVGPAGEPAAADQAPELTRVQLSGSYLADRSVPVRATLPATRGAPASGIGFFWMTPFSVDGAVVFINRGFVPSGGDFRPPVIATPEGPRTITGLLRLPEQRRFFTAADDPARQEFSIRDPKAMAAAVGLDPAAVAPFFIDAERSPGDATPPVGIDARELIARIPNNHLQYALTWFGLALTLVGVFAAFVRQRLKGTT